MTAMKVKDDVGSVRWVHWQKHYQKDEVVGLGDDVMFTFFLKKKMRFTPCTAEQPLRGMELQEKEAQKH